MVGRKLRFITACISLRPIRCEDGSLREARAHGDASTGLAEGAGDFQTNARVPAGDDNVLARQVEARQNLVGCRGSRELGSQGMLFICYFLVVLRVS